MKTPLRFTNILKGLLILGVGLLSSINATALSVTDVKWKFEARRVEANVYDLIFKATIADGVHMFPTTVPIDEYGLEQGTPTTFVFDQKTFTQIGKVKEAGGFKTEFDETINKDVTVIYKNATFIIRVKLTKPVSMLTGEVSYGFCDVSCMQWQQKFKFPVNYEEVKGGSKTGSIETGTAPVDSQSSSPFVQANNTKQKIEKPVSWKYEAKKLKDGIYELRFKASIQEGWHIYSTEPQKDGGPTPTTVSIDKKEGLEVIGKFQSTTPAIEKKDSIYNYRVHEHEVTFTQQVKITKGLNEVSGNIDYMSCDDIGKCVFQNDDFKIKLDDHTTIQNDDSKSLSWVFGQGLFFGFVALLTPCVFPMIPLTVSFFLKKSGKKMQGILKAMLYGLSIIAIYVGLGYFISLIFGPDALNSMSSNVYFNLAFFIIFIIFAVSFFGAFEITLPSSWANKADAKSDKGGLIGIFFMALTLAIVSFSCTGPFMGTLLVQSAQSAGFTGPVTGMFGFSLALAIPFTLFAIFPSWMHNLPKSGGWLNSVKVVMGFIELALALKFFSTVDMAYHWNILYREYFLAIWIIIFALLGFYLLGKLRFSHDSELTHISIPRLLFAILSFAFAAYMVPGLFGAPVKILSGLAPPIEYSEGWKLGGGETQQAATQTPDKKYAKLFHCPLGLDCFFDYQQALEHARKTGKPLMLDFTGHSCVNCRKMEQNVWSDPSVLAKIKNDYILVSLYADDRTDLPESEQFYSKALDKKVTNIGLMWKDLQAKRYNTIAQPYYVLLDHNEQTLVEPRGYTPDIAEYAAYLESGKTEFQKRKDQSKN